MKPQILKASGFTPRIQRLRDEVINAKSTICPERARFYTDVYRDHADKPLIIRRALALSRTLKNMTIFIETDALIVGNQASQLKAAPIFPEYAVEWIEKEIDEFEKRPGDQFYPSREVKDEILDICKFWRGTTTLDKGRALMGEKLHEIHEAGIISAEGNLTSGDAHIAVDNEKILAEGLDQFIHRVREHFERENNTTLEGIKHRNFYESLGIGLTALQDFIIRFADLAGSQAEAAGITPQRSDELREIEEICRVIADC